MARQDLSALAQSQTVAPAQSGGGGVDWIQRFNETIENVRSLVREAQTAGLVNLPQNQAAPAAVAPIERKAERVIVKQQDETIKKAAALIMAALDMQVAAGNGDVPIGEFIASQKISIREVSELMHKAVGK